MALKVDCRLTKGASEAVFFEGSDWDAPLKYRDEEVALSKVQKPPEIYKIQSTTGLTYTIFATREGLVGGTTANGHVIVPHDHFVALPSRRALCSNGGYEFQVTLSYSGRTVTAPVLDVGPWNTKDDYWNPSSIREMWQDLPQGTPEAQAAYQNGYNGGQDQFGRTVTNPAGIDLADGTFWDNLGMTNNDWVSVNYLWTGVTAPPPPTLASPSNGTTGVSTSPTLSWNSSSGATSYALQVSTSSAFSSFVVNQSGITSTSYTVSGLANNTTYYWRVNAFSSAGTSGWSSIWSFTTSVIVIHKIYVPDDYSTIQEAVNAANPGDTIIVRDGTYSENVDVNKEYLTIRSENGADVTIIQAANPDDHVFEVTVNYVNVSGLTVKGATAEDKVGIYLNRVNSCNISNDKCLNNYGGIGLYYSN